MASPISPSMGPRDDYLSWDDFFMGLSVLAAQRSKDPSTQVGCCIVDPNNRILSLGYNGFPRGCDDRALPWAREGDFLDTKYAYVVHAEQNAVLNKNSASLEGARMYVGLFPCNDCAKVIIQSGIREVIYLSDKYHEAPAFVASRRMFDLSGVAYRQHAPTVDSITLRFSNPASVPPSTVEKGEASAASVGGVGTSSSSGSGGGSGSCSTQEGAAAQPV